MKYENIISDLKNKVYYPIYLLSGEEPYFIDQITSFIEKNILTENERDFNQTILYGKETDAATIVSYAKKFPMMANHNVVIVKEAQNLRNFDLLNNYAQEPLKSTVLVLCYKHKKFDKRKKIVNVLKKNKCVFFESTKLYENQIQAWIENIIKQNKRKINPKALFLMVEYLGADLSKINNEIQKLLITTNDNQEITETHIAENIGISKDYNIFELYKALAAKNVLKTNQIINYFNSNPKEHPLIVTINMLFLFFSKVMKVYYVKDKDKKSIAAELKVHPFFVTDYINASKKYGIKKLRLIITLLREYDARVKGINNLSATEQDLLRELIFIILH